MAFGIAARSAARESGGGGGSAAGVPTNARSIGRWNFAARSLSRGRSHGKTERQRKMAAEKICIAHSKAIRIVAKRDFTAAIARFGPVENPRETWHLELRRDRRLGKAAAEEDPRRGSRRTRVQSVAGTSQRGRFRAEEAMEKRKDKGRWRRRKYA